MGIGPRSSDLNPRENAWSILKMKVLQRVPTNIEELQDWRGMTKNRPNGHRNRLYRVVWNSFYGYWERSMDDWLLILRQNQLKFFK